MEAFRNNILRQQVRFAPLRQGGRRIMARSSLTYQLASIAEDAIGPADRVFQKRFGLHVHEIRVLRLIDDQPNVTFTELAAQTKIERSATSRILSRLIKAGYVRRKIDEKDARHFQLTATAKARALRQRADPLTEDIENMVLSVLSATQRQQLEVILGKLTGWLHTDFLIHLVERYPDAKEQPRKQRS
jgi:DNA-binding MarR family transcriptional regulator